MTDRIDTAKEREWLDKLTGYTPGPWDASGLTVYDTCMDGVASCHADADARLIAAAPDMKATLSSALVALDAKDAEIERLKDDLENAQQAASETHGSWEARCHAILTALGLDYGQDEKQDAFQDILNVERAENERLRSALRECEGALDLHGKMYPQMVKGYTLDALNAARAELNHGVKNEY